MLDDLMGKMGAQQEEMQKRLEEMVVEFNQGGISVKGNGHKVISDIEISEDLLTSERKDEVQDLLISVINSYILLADEEQEKLSQNILSNLLPGDLGGMFGE